MNFLMLKVWFQKTPEQFCHVRFQYQDDLVVITIDCVPVLAFAIVDLQIRFFVDVVIVNVHSQLEFVPMRKLQRILVSKPQMVFRFVQSVFQKKRRFWDLQWICCIFSVGFVFGSGEVSCSRFSIFSQCRCYNHHFHFQIENITVILQVCVFLTWFHEKFRENGSIYNQKTSKKLKRKLTKQFFAED